MQKLAAPTCALARMRLTVALLELPPWGGLWQTCSGTACGAVGRRGQAAPPGCAQHSARGRVLGGRSRSTHFPVAQPGGCPRTMDWAVSSSLGRARPSSLPIWATVSAMPCRKAALGAALPAARNQAAAAAVAAGRER